MLKPQDIFVLLQVHCLGTDWNYAQLGQSLKMSASTVYEALQRCAKSRLYHSTKRKILRGNLEEFLVHGITYAFPVTVGAIARGIPTAHAASPLKELLMVNETGLYVWASPMGKVKGQTIEPLYKTVPDVVLKQSDRRLYELLALVDSLRVGKVREKELAIKEIKKRLNV